MKSFTTFLHLQISHYEEILLTYTSKLQHLTLRVDYVESGKLSYTELEFQLLRTEIRDLERLVDTLRLDINTTFVYSISAEVWLCSYIEKKYF